MAKVKTFITFSIALDESTDISSTAQLVIYLRGVDIDLSVTEDFMDMISMTDTTTRADILLAVEEAIDGMGLTWERLTSVTTDGAPAMRGDRRGFVGLLREKLGHSKLPAVHCMVHQEALYSKVAVHGDVMNTVVRTVNYVRSNGLNHRQFKEFLSSMEEDYPDISIVVKCVG
jgi:hypothetical protein